MRKGHFMPVAFALAFNDFLFSHSIPQLSKVVATRATQGLPIAELTLWRHRGPRPLSNLVKTACTRVQYMFYSPSEKQPLQVPTRLLSGRIRPRDLSHWSPNHSATRCPVLLFVIDYDIRQGIGKIYTEWFSIICYKQWLLFYEGIVEHLIIWVHFPML